MGNPYPANFETLEGSSRLTGQVDFTDAGNQPGGTTPVSCLLARDAVFDIHALGNYDVLWDALYDNFWDLDPLAAIPAGLGLTFAFDGSSSLIVPTEAGVWALSYLGSRQSDDNWTGEFVVGGVGWNFAWVQPKAGVAGTVTSQGQPYMAGSITAPLSSGAQLTHQVATDNAAANNPSLVTQIQLSIVRLG